MWFGKRSGFFSSLTRHSRSRKQGRLGHVIGTRETSRGRSLIHFIWFLTTWITVKNSNKCVFVLISMLGRLKNSHSSCVVLRLKWTKAANQSFGSMMPSRFPIYMAFIGSPGRRRQRALCNRRLALHGPIIEHSIRSNKSHTEVSVVCIV